MELFDLLIEMRGEIEFIFAKLREMGWDEPVAPSQSLRAARAIDWIDSFPLLEKTHSLLDAKYKLKDFLIIHRASILLEKRQRKLKDVAM